MSNRIKWIEFVRCIAILFVVLCHSTESIYHLNVGYISILQLPTKSVAFSLFSMGRLGVPLFLMISGYLLLDREYSSDKCVKFWKNNWLHLLICTEVWWIIYNLFDACFGQSISLKDVLEQMLFFKNISMSHGWYMPMILGMYILIPVVANALKAINPKYLWFPILFFSFYKFGYSLIYLINNVVGHESLSLMMSLGFSGGEYGLYLLMGYIIKKGHLKKINSFFISAFFASAFVCMVVLQIWAYGHNYAYNVWYDNLFLFIAAVSLFELLSRMNKIPFCRITKYIADYSFPVYLIHNMVMKVATATICQMLTRNYERLVVLYLVTIIISLVIIRFIRLIPKVGRYILYIK